MVKCFQSTSEFLLFAWMGVLNTARDSVSMEASGRPGRVQKVKASLLKPATWFTVSVTALRRIYRNIAFKKDKLAMNFPESACQPEDLQGEQKPLALWTSSDQELGSHTREGAAAFWLERRHPNAHTHIYNINGAIILKLEYFSISLFLKKKNLNDEILWGHARRTHSGSQSWPLLTATWNQVSAVIRKCNCIGHTTMCLIVTGTTPHTMWCHCIESSN